MLKIDRRLTKLYSQKEGEQYYNCLLQAILLKKGYVYLFGMESVNLFFFAMLFVAYKWLDCPVSLISTFVIWPSGLVILQWSVPAPSFILLPIKTNSSFEKGEVGGIIDYFKTEKNYWRKNGTSFSLFLVGNPITLSIYISIYFWSI